MQQPTALEALALLPGSFPGHQGNVKCDRKQHLSRGSQYQVTKPPEGGSNRLHYALGALEKSKRGKKGKEPCSCVAADQNPIKHCLVLHKPPVIACWLMKLMHYCGTKETSALECTAFPQAVFQTNLHGVHTWQMLTPKCTLDDKTTAGHR